MYKKCWDKTEKKINRKWSRWSTKEHLLFQKWVIFTSLWTSPDNLPLEVFLTLFKESRQTLESTTQFRCSNKEIKTKTNQEFPFRKFYPNQMRKKETLSPLPRTSFKKQLRSWRRKRSESKQQRIETFSPCLLTDYKYQIPLRSSRDSKNLFLSSEKRQRLRRCSRSDRLLTICPLCSPRRENSL